jgi:hypothetical protein
LIRYLEALKRVTPVLTEALEPLIPENPEVSSASLLLQVKL